MSRHDKFTVILTVPGARHDVEPAFYCRTLARARWLAKVLGSAPGVTGVEGFAILDEAEKVVAKGGGLRYERAG